jgi:NADPH:quinone reductase-like Zn-dependent oxidoreductase
MRAVILNRYGSANELMLGEIPRPTCGNDQVLVQVHAAGVNPIDWRIRNGLLRMVLPARFPLVLGFDIAGQIVETGPNASVRGWNVGDEVVCFLDNRHGGGYAEYAAAGVDVLARKPAAISYEEAAGVPLAASTALQALRDRAQLQAGQDLLINGASGGVGTFAVQLGKAMGAAVTGVCSGDNLDYVRQLGADRVIDYRREDFTSMQRVYDVIFDAAAKSSYWQSRRVLKPRGCFVTTVPSASSVFFRVVTALAGRRCRHVLVQPRGEDLRLIVQMIDEGKIRPEVQQAYSLAEASTAHEVSEAGHVRGKLVLSLREPLEMD